MVKRCAPVASTPPRTRYAPTWPWYLVRVSEAAHANGELDQDPPEEILLQHCHGGDCTCLSPLRQRVELGIVSGSITTACFLAHLEVGGNEIGDISRWLSAAIHLTRFINSLGVRCCSRTTASHVGCEIVYLSNQHSPTPPSPHRFHLPFHSSCPQRSALLSRVYLLRDRSPLLHRYLLHQTSSLQWSYRWTLL